jgi:predicted Rossmann fold nucleotide-binding protein DprA/Smf involved in DNA uptake
MNEIPEDQLELNDRHEQLVYLCERLERYDIAAHADKPPRRQTKPQLLLAKLQYDRWMTREDIANATGMSLSSISTYLTDLRKAKLVDNQNRMWRRRAPPPVNETMIVAAPRLDNLNGIADGRVA